MEQLKIFKNLCETNCEIKQIIIFQTFGSPYDKTLKGEAAILWL